MLRWSCWVFFFFALFPLCQHAQDARHHGWYGPEGQLCWVVSLLTILLALCSLGSLAPDARYHGRYGPQGHFGWVLLVTIQLALCFFPWRQAQGALHHGRYGKEGKLCRCCLVEMCLLCATTGALGLEVQKIAGFSVVAVLQQGRPHPCLDAVAASHGPDCLVDFRDSPVALRLVVGRAGAASARAVRTWNLDIISRP